MEYSYGCSAIAIVSISLFSQYCPLLLTPDANPVYRRWTFYDINMPKLHNVSTNQLCTFHRLCVHIHWSGY